MQDQETIAAQRQKFNSELLGWVQTVAGTFVAVILIFTFAMRTAPVSGTSMVPTLEEGDRLILTHINYTPSYGDIVVITQPNYFNEPLIKRVIATGGQTIDIDFYNGFVFVDGKIIDEPYIFEPTLTQDDISFPQQVPEGYVFVMGDNRNASSDSRSSLVGMIREEYILGKAIFRVFPFKHFGRIK